MYVIPMTFIYLSVVCCDIVGKYNDSNSTLAAQACLEMNDHNFILTVVKNISNLNDAVGRLCYGEWLVVHIPRWEPHCR